MTKRNKKMPAKKSKSSGALNVHKNMSKSQLILIALVFGLVGGFVLRSSYAASHKPGGGGGGSGGTISMRMVTDTNSDGLPNYRDVVTFDVSTSATAFPQVVANCSQNGTVVYSHSAGFYPTYPWPWAQNFGLESYAWSAGAADCTAKLYYQNSKGTSVYLNTLNFHVNH